MVFSAIIFSECMQRSKEAKKQRKGFTLVEIMIVVVIVGLLAAMAVPAFQKVRTTSRDKVVANNVRQILAAYNMYTMEHGAIARAYRLQPPMPANPLVGIGKYIRVIDPVAGERYEIRRTGSGPFFLSVNSGYLANPKTYALD